MRVFPIDGVADQHERLSATLTASVGFTSSKILPTTGDFIGLRARSALISVETADIRFTIDGTTPTTTALGGIGHLLQVGSSYEINGEQNIENFRCINAVASSGSILQCTYLF
jgi:hypothetical protein